MKMVKSLLLGSAAGFVAVAGAQAADLPVKAKAVEYVKVCSLYGAGFYYIPGTDTCIKIGGYVRAEYTFNGAPSGANLFTSGADGRWNQAETRYFDWYTRFNLSVDTRTQTEYGTLRSYIRFGLQHTTGAQGNPDTETAARADDGELYWDRAFIQFAGFTFGKTVSPFAFWSAGSGVAYLTAKGTADMGNGTANSLLYTAMLGNGVSATFGVHDTTSYSRRGILNNAINSSLNFGSGYTNSYGSMELPDFVANVRVDQAWGSAQIAGLVHQVRSAYYGSAAGGLGLTSAGAPSQKYGFGITGGLDINLPFAKGDRLILQGTYSEGWIQAVNGMQTVGIWHGGASVTIQNNFDAIYGTGSALELTTAYGFIGGIEHYWTPTLRSSLWGDWYAIRYNANARALYCTSVVTANYFGAGSTCNPDNNYWAIGSRTIWTPVPNLDLGVEVAYHRLQTNHSGATGAIGSGAMPVGAYTHSDNDQVSVQFRAQRSFWN